MIIGGREFGSGMHNMINDLKHRVEVLGLQDEIAFIEDYNPEDARTIFQGMNATVMLSDEFLEASATSMEKGIVNGAALIGVFGSAIRKI